MKKILIVFITLMLLSVVSVLAIPPPANVDPFAQYKTSDLLSAAVIQDYELPTIEITPSPLSIAGSSCSNLYTTTNEYCSGHIRIYYQCLQTSEGSEYQQRSEDCSKYPGGGICVEEGNKASCKDYAGQTKFGIKLLIYVIALLLIGIVLVIFVHVAAPAPQVVGVGMILYAIFLFIKLLLGGV